MTVTVPKRVLKHWREISADTHKASVDLLLTSKMDSFAATRLLSQSVDRVVAAFEAAHLDVPPGEDMPFAGQWDVARVPEGALLVGGFKSDAFEEVLKAIVDDLGRQGVRGKLDLHALPEVPWPPTGIGSIEANIRVLGRRVPDRRARWAADRAALDRVLTAATRWCLEARPDRGVVLSGTALPSLLLRRCDSPVERLREVLGDNQYAVALSSIGEDWVRRVSVESEYGGITVVEGGPGLHRVGWRRPVGSINELLRRVSPDAVYASVRRTGPHAPGDRPLGSSIEAFAYEERAAPDAFPVQLLGPGYAGRVPSGEDWRATDLGADRVLLEHVDPAAWFDEITLEAALRGERIPSHEVVERARASFAEILFQAVTDEERDRKLTWDIAHPQVRLPEEIVEKVHALPETRCVGHWDVAFVLRDGTLVEDIQLGHNGWTVTRVGGEREFALDVDAIVDVLAR
jgi:hypothetical protein